MAPGAGGPAPPFLPVVSSDHVFIVNLSIYLGTLLRKLKKGYVRSAPPSGGPPVTVEGQGGQNQLYERSTENDVFQMKTERKTEEKIPPQIFGK